jgi:hypothetical protein
MPIDLIALSSITMMLNNLERFAHNNLDTLWFFFAISTFIFIALIVWLIIASVSKKQQQEIVISSEISRVKVLPNDPFVRSESSGSSDMDYKLISQDELNSSRPNYLISSSPGEDELDLLQSEIKLYEDSLLQEKDFNLHKDFNSEDMSDNIYGDMSSNMDLTDYSSLQNSEFDARSPMDSPLEQGRKSKVDFSLPEKVTPISHSSRKSEDRRKIELPRKDMPSSKDKKIEDSPSFPEFSSDRAGPMKAMRIELPQKGKNSEAQKDISTLGSKGGRINLPKKMSN